MMNARAALFLSWPLVFVLAGCGQGMEIAGRQSRVIESSDPGAVLSAAATILRREFGRVHVDADARTIVCEPVEFRTTRQSGTARDFYGGRSTMRRGARLSVGRRGGKTVARLRVDVERKDTARALSARPRGGRLSDTPAYTPIERDAATTERQNTVWTRVRRDRGLERQLLRELQERFAPPPVAEEAAAEQPAEDQAGGTP